MRIEGLHIYIESLKLDDVFEMRKWGEHENPLLEDYNFPMMNDSEIRVWYKMKTNKASNKYFSIKDKNDTLIGYMGMKDIKFLRRISTLGIVLDPNKVDQGYGTEILETFLHHYFTQMRMRKMLLEVSAFNKRAYRLYEKIGFVQDKEYIEEFFNQYLDLDDPYYLEEESSFEVVSGNIYTYIYKMSLTRKRFFQMREKSEIQTRS